MVTVSMEQPLKLSQFTYLRLMVEQSVVLIRHQFLLAHHHSIIINSIQLIKIFLIS